MTACASMADAEIAIAGEGQDGLWWTGVHSSMGCWPWDYKANPRPSWLSKDED